MAPLDTAPIDPRPIANGGNLQYSMANIAWLVNNVGMGHSDKQKAIAVAVAWAESKGYTRAHNPRPPDDSYGLWQINMYKALGPARRAQFGLKSNEDLFVPANNALAAKTISWNGANFGAWSTYKDGTYNKYMLEAIMAVKNPQEPKAGGFGGGEEQTDTVVGGKIKEALIDPVLDFLRTGALRVAGFIGGILLIIVALVMLTKKAALPAAAKTVTRTVAQAGR